MLVHHMKDPFRVCERWVAAPCDGRWSEVGLYFHIIGDGTKKHHIPMGMDSSHFIDGHDPKTMVCFDHDTSKVLRYLPSGKQTKSY